MKLTTTTTMKIDNSEIEDHNWMKYFSPLDKITEWKREVENLESNGHYHSEMLNSNSKSESCTFYG